MVDKISSNNKKLIIFSGFSILLLAIGLTLSPSLPELWDGLKIILTHPSLIDFDSFYFSSNFGSPFVNASITLAIMIVIVKLSKANISGNLIAALMMIIGFSFYGKNFLNVWFPMAGVFIHTSITEHTIKQKVPLMLFSTAISPIFSVLAFGTEALKPGSVLAIAVGVFGGVLGGYLTAILAAYLPVFHHGVLLYNAGFAAGVSATFINIVLVAIGLNHGAYPYGDSYVTDQNTLFAIVLFILFAYFISIGLIMNGFKNFKRLFWYSCTGGDYCEDFGFAASLVNMGVVGILMTAYVLFIARGSINGTTFTCIMTASGFAAAGSTLRTQLPPMIGVFLGAFITGGILSLLSGDSFLVGAFAKIATRGMILSVIFSCGVAPVTHEYGTLAAVFIGVIHSMFAPTIGPLHGWMSLYNNGFSFGLLVTFLYPIYSTFPKSFAEHRENKKQST